jgi:hypothetical protein
MRDLIKQIIKEELHKWSKEEVLDLARNFTKMNDFKKSYPKAYSAARNNKWLPDVRLFMTPAYETWTKEKAHKEALKYQYMNDFQKKSASAYQTAAYHGWLKDITTHMIPKHVNWTEDMLWKEALKYETMRDFIKNSYAAYGAAYRRKILPKITSHMKPLGNRTKRIIYAYEFPDNFVYVGLTYDLDYRDKSHRKKERSQVYQHIDKSGLVPTLKQLTLDYVPATEAQLLEKQYIEEYKENGWNILNKATAGGLGSSVLENWTLDKILNISLNYQNKTLFCSENRSACNAAKRFGWYEQVTQHMDKLKTNWTEDELKKEALKYSSRNEFKQNSRNAYNAALKRNIIDDITVHMGKPKKNQFDTEYDKTKISDLIKQYSDLSDFRKENPNTYAHILKKGWNDELLSQLNKKIKFWTDDEIFDEAMKYKTIIDFRNNSPKAYGAAKDRKLTDLIRVKMGLKPRQPS